MLSLLINLIRTISVDSIGRGQIRMFEEKPSKVLIHAELWRTISSIVLKGKFKPILLGNLEYIRFIYRMFFTFINQGKMG